MMLAVRRIGLTLALCLGALACDDSAGHGTAIADNTTADSGADPDAGAAPVPRADLQELLDLGIGEFLGAAKPIASETLTGVAGIADGSTVYDFDPKDGPVCMRGAGYHVSLLDQGSKNLVIFLQGGGACVSVLCSATIEATPRGVPTNGVLDIHDAENPVADWNILYVPYCDGSVFGGNNDFHDAAKPNEVRLHHGQRNFSAALDLALAHFPHPEKVLLAGSSAGGWGTVYHRALVRSQYPDAQLTVMNDSGIGFMVNTQLVVDEWGSGRYRPPSCEACQTPQHMSEFVKYELAHDPGVVVGDFSSWEDSVIMRFTLNTDPAAFHALLQEQTNIPAAAFPNRYKRFIITGSQHTSLQRGYHDTQINGVSIAQWLGTMIARDPSWVEMLQE
jgi:hypothetical protein